MTSKRGTPIRCGYCGGTGHTILSSTYEGTLRMLRHAKRATGADLARTAEIKATAMNNRLSYLLKLGLVKAEKDGRQVWYEVT